MDEKGRMGEMKALYECRIRHSTFMVRTRGEIYLKNMDLLIDCDGPVSICKYWSCRSVILVSYKSVAQTHTVPEDYILVFRLKILAQIPKLN